MKATLGFIACLVVGVFGAFKIAPDLWRPEVGSWTGSEIRAEHRTTNSGICHASGNFGDGFFDGFGRIGSCAASSTFGFVWAWVKWLFFRTIEVTHLPTILAGLLAGTALWAVLMLLVGLLPDGFTSVVTVVGLVAGLVALTAWLFAGWVAWLAVLYAAHLAFPPRKLAAIIGAKILVASLLLVYVGHAPVLVAVGLGTIAFFLMAIVRLVRRIAVPPPRTRRA